MEPRPGEDREYYTHYQLPDSEFDELVVGQWLHIEQMDTGVWWMSVGGVWLTVTADRDGRPKRVIVDGPTDPVDGCRYECLWEANTA